jgi:prevent-host-death family protein
VGDAGDDDTEPGSGKDVADGGEHERAGRIGSAEREDADGRDEAPGADLWVPKTRSLRTDSGQGSSSATLVSVSHIAQKELRNHVGEVLRRAEAGETLTVTVAGRPVAELGPAHRRRWVSGATLAGIWRAKAPRGLDADLERLPAGVVDPFAS